jgi:hypothetical protein
MSIVATLKLHEGLVIGADSSAHIYQTIPNVGPRLIKDYAHGQKIFRVKDLKIAIVAYGMSNIGARSVASLFQEFIRVKGTNFNESIGVQDIAQSFYYMMKERYDQFYGAVIMADRPEMGFLITGYSKNDLVAHEFEFVLPHDLGIKRIKEQHFFGLEWRGVKAPFERLYKGYDPKIIDDLISQFNLSKPEVEDLLSKHQTPVDYTGMPLADGVEFIKHILNTTVNHSKFELGNPTCLPPIDLVVLTKEKYEVVEGKTAFI